MYSVEAENVSKYFGSFKAIEDISLKLKEGQRLILLGPNGAGKTTLLRLLSGLIKPDEGYIKIFGEHTFPYNAKVRGLLSFVGENYSLYDNLTVMDNLLFFGTLYNLERDEIIEKSKDILERLNALVYANKKVGELSRGTKQKIAICRAMLNDPKLLLLDEPTAFLDPYAVDEVHKIMDESDATIVYATQRFDEIHKIKGSIMIINKGKRVAYGPLDDVLSKLKGIEVEIFLLNNKRIKLENLDAKQRGNRIVVRAEDASEIPEIIEEIIGKGGKIISVNYLRESISEKMVIE